jgi:tRNA G18 (ribose-2'-O)-methylase SpoU
MTDALADVTVILDNVRSLYNVGAVMRAAAGAGVRRLTACGITPYPSRGAGDPRRGPVAARADRELRKTALAAYDYVRVESCATVEGAIAAIRAEGATIVAVERAPGAVPFWSAAALDAAPLAVILGHEVEGVAASALALADAVVDIPMFGAGHSLNVAVAAGVILYEIARRRALRHLPALRS